MFFVILIHLRLLYVVLSSERRFFGEQMLMNFNYFFKWEALWMLCIAHAHNLHYGCRICIILNKKDFFKSPFYLRPKIGVLLPWGCISSDKGRLVSF